jgi:hypothetical protein
MAVRFVAGQSGTPPAWTPFQDWLQSLQERSMAREYKPGDIVPQSGIYTITHDRVHADMPHEVTIIKRRRFSTIAARTWVFCSIGATSTTAS